MKKILAFAIAAIAAASMQAASVGWTNAGLTAYAGDQYAIFVIGQNNVESVSQITTLLKGENAANWGNYAFGSGTINNSGLATVAATSSGKTLAGGSTYESFFVIFDSDSLEAGTSKFAVLSGRSGQTASPGANAATFSFTAGNWTVAQAQGDTLSSSTTWETFGIAQTPVDPDPDPVPEPTSVALLAIGLAALGLKRKVA